MRSMVEASPPAQRWWNDPPPSAALAVPSSVQGRMTCAIS